MGGIGSGRRWHYGTKDTTTSFRRLDVRRWARDGLLDKPHSFGWEWNNDRGEVKASINVRTKPNSVHLTYRSRIQGEDWRDYDYTIWLDRTPCNYGGTRPWFLCPAQKCGRRVAILYGGTIFACRNCHRLAYPSQNESQIDRAQRRANTLRARLGWEIGFEAPGIYKPKGMHQRTYNRLSQEVYALEDQVHAAFVRSTAQFLQRFDG